MTKLIDSFDHWLNRKVPFKVAVAINCAVWFIAGVIAGHLFY